MRHLGNSWNGDGDYIPQDFGDACPRKTSILLLLARRKPTSASVEVLGLLLKAGVRKFRALLDFTSLVANCYYVHAVAII